MYLNYKDVCVIVQKKSDNQIAWHKNAVVSPSTHNINQPIYKYIKNIQISQFFTYL